MTVTVTVPNTFANANTTIPLVRLDENFTAIADSIDDIGNGVTPVASSLKNYTINGSNLGTTSGSVNLSLTSGNFFIATVNAATTWTFTNVAASGTMNGAMLALSNGGAYAQTFTNVAWSAGTAPTFTSNGLDLLVFISYDGGVTWNGIPSSLDSK